MSLTLTKVLPSNSYAACHHRVHRDRGKATNCVWGCQSDNYDWANLTGNYENVDDYAQMCRSCHARYDAARRTMSENYIPPNEYMTTLPATFEKAQTIRRMAIELGDQKKRKVTIDEMLGELIKAYRKLQGASPILSHDEGTSYCTGLPDHAHTELQERLEA